MDPQTGLVIQNGDWIKPQKEIIFTIKPDTETFLLNDISLYAKKIKAHIYIHTGRLLQTKMVTWSFTTLYDAAKITITYHPQPAISYTNEIITLKLDHRRQIDVKRNGDYPSQNFHFTFEILLYK